MVKDHVLSNCGQYNRTIILIFTHMVHYITKNMMFNFWASMNGFTIVFNKRTVSHSLSLSFVLLVVSMELWSPHKLAEIRPRHSNEGFPDPSSCTTPEFGLLNEDLYAVHESLK